MKINRLVEHQEKDEKRELRLKEGIEMQMRGSKFRKKIDPLDRGWSGTRLPGCSVGPPDPFQGGLLK